MLANRLCDAITSMETEQDFLAAIANGKHRRGAGSRLKKIVARREKAQFGRLCCYCCGLAVTVGGANIEHIKPQALGGTWAIGNLALSHPACNVKRGHEHTARALQAG